MLITFLKNVRNYAAKILFNLEIRHTFAIRIEKHALLLEKHEIFNNILVVQTYYSPTSNLDGR